MISKSTKLGVALGCNLFPIIQVPMNYHSHIRETPLEIQSHSQRQDPRNNVYRLKSYLPEIELKGTRNIMNLTRSALNSHQMLYLDLYENSGIRLLEPYDEEHDEDDNLTFGKVKVVELGNLSERCKRTLSYFHAGRSQKVRRDNLRKNIFNRLNLVDDSHVNLSHDQASVKYPSRDNSKKRIPMNITERNRRLPKKEKYLINKLGIVTGDHMFKVQSNHNLTGREYPQGEYPKREQLNIIKSPGAPLRKTSRVQKSCERLSKSKQHVRYVKPEADMSIVQTLGH